MNRTLTRTRAAAAAVAMAGLLLASCSSTETTGSDVVTDVSAQEAIEVVAQDEVRLLDVRTAEEFAQGHIEGALNIDVTSPDFSAAVATLPKDATWFVYCRSGNRSGVATDAMAELGFTSMYDLQGGVIDWAAAGGTLVT